MNRWVAIVLGIVALFAGGLLFGWKGVVLVMAVLIGWMLVEFWKLMRLMGMASKGPVGRVQSAAALNERLRPGLKLVDVLPMTGSLGEKLGDAPLSYGWTDAGGARVEIVLQQGRLLSWQLIQPDAAPAASC